MIPDYEIMLLGGRAGKSSLMAAMHQDIFSFCYNSPFSIIPTDNTGMELMCTCHELKDLFSPIRRRRNAVTLDPPGAALVKEFLYFVRSGYESVFRLHFTELPGTYLTYYEEELRDRILEHAEKSDVILIGVHTPALMEEIQPDTGFGKYHMELNRVNEVTRIIKNSFSQSEKEHLVLFVPLQCEAYYHRNRMKEIPQAIRQGYRELLAYLTHSEQITVAVSPALTVGGINFFRFKSNSDQPVYTYGLPSEFSPRHCGHFLSLILLYAYYQLERYHSLRQFFPPILPDPKIMAFRKMQKHRSDLHSLEREQAGPGFSILHDPKQYLRISAYT